MAQFKRTDLVSLIKQLQKNSDEVEKNILYTEKNLNKDVLKINKGKLPLYQDATKREISTSQDLLIDLYVDAAAARHLKHPQADMIEKDVKLLHEHVKRLHHEYKNIYHLTGSESGPYKIIDEQRFNSRLQLAFLDEAEDLETFMDVQQVSSSLALMNFFSSGVTKSVRDTTVPAVGKKPAGSSHTIAGEISGVEIRKEMKCSRCHQMQENFDEEACTHKCEKCKLLQRSQRYACVLTGTLVVLSEGTEATLMLTSPVIMKYLQANNLGDLMEHPDSLEKHFLGNAQYLVSYDGEVVSDLTMIDQSGDNTSFNH